MTESQQLIADYVETGSEAAFRQLTERYVNLVYSVARRLVNGDEHLAQDVTQMVFADLARKAGTLSPDVMLGGWLHRHTCFTAAKILRGERRRQIRERQAVEMSQLHYDSGADFPAVAPILDGAIDELGEAERTAILLRFFEGRDFRSIGEAMGGSEDAARMRVNRALEKLEAALKRRGVRSTGAALGVALTANAVQAAPAGMAAAVSTYALAAGTAGVVTGAKVMAMTAMQKAMVAGVLALAVGAVVYEASQAHGARAEAAALQQAQAGLTAQAGQMQRERDEATNQLVGLLAAQTNAQPDENELLRLRSEVPRLRAASGTNDTARATATVWLSHVAGLKDYLKRHPEETVPELQVLSSESRWLNAVDISMLMTDYKTPDDYYKSGAYFLRAQAGNDIGVEVQVALQKFSQTNNGAFPTSLTQLRPYCDPEVADILEQYYEIKPASIIPASVMQGWTEKPDQVVRRKQPIEPNSRSRGAFFAYGSVWWQASPGEE